VQLLCYFSTATAQLLHSNCTTGTSQSRLWSGW